MIAALGTLAFLTTLWLLVVVGAAVLEESGGKIAAALKGHSRSSANVHFAALRVRTRSRFTQPMRGRARWRDAA